MTLFLWQNAPKNTVARAKNSFKNVFLVICLQRNCDRNHTNKI